MPLIAPAAEWDSLSRKMAAEVPEAFASEGRVLNLFEGEWKNVGFERHYTSAIDGRSLGRIPMLDLDSALAAGKFAKSEARSWAAVDLDERRRRVSACLAGLKQRRELIALLLMWEIGKPHAQALTDIDRCISGVEWYVQNIESMLAGRSPLGLISNIASWNYPMSVLMHSVLVQVLAGNATISKTPAMEASTRSPWLTRSLAAQGCQSPWSAVPAASSVMRWSGTSMSTHSLSWAARRTVASLPPRSTTRKSVTCSRWRV